jgi:hypothetical protein
MGSDALSALLSAQCQALATILGLLFTTAVVAAQLSSRYSHRVLHHVISGWALWYLVPYLLGVALPLLILGELNARWILAIDLFIAGGCLLLLVPYFLVLRSKLGPDYVLGEAEDRARAAFDDAASASESEADEEFEFSDTSLSLVRGIALEALSSHDYVTFRSSLSVMERLFQHALADKPPAGRFIEWYRGQLVREIGYLGREAVHCPDAPFAAVGALVHAGQLAAAQKLEHTVEGAILTLGKILAGAEDQDDIYRWTIGAFGLVGEAAIEHTLWGAARCAEDIIAEQIGAANGVRANALSKATSAGRRIAGASMQRAALAYSGGDRREFRNAMKCLGRAILLLSKLLKAAVGARHDDAGRRAAWTLQEIVVSSRSAGISGVAARVARSVCTIWKPGECPPGLESTKAGLLTLLGQIVSPHGDEVSSDVRRISMTVSREVAKPIVTGCVQLMIEIAKNASGETARGLQLQAIRSFGYVSQNAFEVGANDAANEVCDYVLASVEKAVEAKNLVFLQDVIEPLGFIGQGAASAESTDVATKVISALKRVAEIAGQAGRMDILGQVLRHASYIAQKAAHPQGGVASGEMASADSSQVHTPAV